MRLTLYVLRLVGLRILGAGAILLAVLQILDLLEITPEIIQRGLGFGGILHYASLRLPRMIDQAAPLSVLAGAIFAFIKLAAESEFVAMRAIGVSAYRLVLMALPAALAVLAVHLVAVQVIAPRTDAALQAWWTATAPPPNPADKDAKPKEKAVRIGDDVFVAKSDDPTGRTLKDVRIYRRDTEGRLTERVGAPVATYGPQGWRLGDPQFVRFGKAGATAGQASEITLAPGFEPADVQNLFFGDQAISAAAAKRALAGGGTQRPPSYYATRLQGALAGPIGDLLMLLLAAPIAMASFRGGQGAVFAAGSLAAGLLFMVVNGLLAALGESGAVGPLLAAWTAPAVFAALGASVLLKLEG